MSSSFFKKAVTGGPIGQALIRNDPVTKALGKSSTVGQVLFPDRYALKTANDSPDALAALKSGDLTDPAGVFHLLGNNTPNDPGAPPSPQADQSSTINARDRLRRAVYRAMGRQSTIRVPFGQTYSPQPKMLIGS